MKREQIVIKADENAFIFHVLFLEHEEDKFLELFRQRKLFEGFSSFSFSVFLGRDNYDLLVSIVESLRSESAEKSFIYLV
jgi:hypothetical protein